MYRLIVLSIAIATAIGQQSTRVPCPMYSPPKVPAGCSLETYTNKNGCPLVRIVCPTCDLIGDCGVGKVCRLNGTKASCMDVRAQVSVAPAGVAVSGRAGGDSLTGELTCAGVTCQAGEKCEIIKAMIECVKIPNCPSYATPAVKPGCRLQDWVDSNNCPKQIEVCDKTECGVNEERLTCGSTCPETCEHYITKVYPSCPRNCIVNVCGCKAGYALDANKQCVKYEDCKRGDGTVSSGNIGNAEQPLIDPFNLPVPTCGENEALQSCGTMCPLTCEMHLSQKPIACVMMCQINVCQCKDGYALDANQKCIPVDQCTLRGNRGKSTSESASAAPAVDCPMFQLPAPADGCYYKFDTDANGCESNPHQVCD